MRIAKLAKIGLEIQGIASIWILICIIFTLYIPDLVIQLIYLGLALAVISALNEAIKHRGSSL